MMYFVMKIEIQYRYMAKAWRLLSYTIIQTQKVSEDQFPSRCLESCENADKLNSLKGLDEN